VIARSLRRVLPSIGALRRQGLRRRRQQGAALIVVVLATILVSASVLMTRVNSGSQASSAGNIEQTHKALREARNVLLGASVADTELNGADVRPGQLPWPDRTVSDDFDGQSDCRAVLAARLGGRYPYLGAGTCNGQTSTIELSNYVADGVGEPLWYFVSRNVVNFDSSETANLDSNRLAERLPNDSPDPPTVLKINPSIVDDVVHPWLRVCDANGNVLADNVAAVIIAPGPALASQTRNPADPQVAQYLDSLTVGAFTISNADSDETQDAAGFCGDAFGGEDFIAHVGLSDAQSSVFNDRLVYITAQELLMAVQRRALNLVRRALEQHVATFGRGPWLSPFAQANAGGPLLNSFVTGGVGGTQLSDAALVPVSSLALVGPFDFDVLFGAGRLVGAAIRNTTDGSTAQIVSANGQTIVTTELVGGHDNQWEVEDGYQIPTFRGDPGTRFGQLPFHDPRVPEDRRANFLVDWEFAAQADVDNFTLSADVRANPTHTAALSAHALSSFWSGPVSIGSANFAPVAGVASGVCRHDVLGLGTGRAHARCQGSATVRTNYLSMSVETSATTSLTATKVLQTNANAEVPFRFVDWGIAIGDIVSNITDGSKAIVTGIGTEPAANSLTTTTPIDGTNNTFTATDVVTVAPASRADTSVFSLGSTATTLIDDAADFIAAGVVPGDVVVLLALGGVPTPAFVDAVVSATELTLVGAGFGIAPTVGNDYQLRTHFVVSRRYSFDLRFTGARTPGPLLSENVYSVESTPSALDGNTNRQTARSGFEIPAADVDAGEQHGAYAVRVQDLDASDAQLAAVTYQITDSSQGYLLVGNIDEDLLLSTGTAAGDAILSPDLPRWIYEQGWHEYIAVGLGTQWQPNGLGVCAIAGDCLTVRSYNPSSLVANPAAQVDSAGVAAVVLGAGTDLRLNPASPRPSADATAYFEGLNGNGDLDDYETRRFNRNVGITNINDQMTIPCTNGINIGVC